MNNLQPILGRLFRAAATVVLALATTGGAWASGGGCDCPSDVDGCGTVDVNDLINVFVEWGATGPDLNADVTGDGMVGVADLIQVIVDWGGCPQVCCGDPEAGECFIAHDSPFCNDAACCDAVCAIDPSCCDDTWDIFCAEQAEGACSG